MPDPAPTKRSGVQFTETMRGHWYPDPALDYKQAAERGRRENSLLEFTLTVAVDDLDAIIADPRTPGRMQGTVTAPRLAATPLAVDSGDFRLFVRDPTQVATRRMEYELDMRAADGRVLHLSGHKVLRDDWGFDMWSDTTTLYVTVSEGPGRGGSILGRGILTIRVDDFRKQLASMRGIGAGGALEHAAAVARFGAYFNKVLAEIYGGIFSKPTVIEPRGPRPRRALRCGPGEVLFFRTADNVELKLTRFNGGGKGPVILAPGFGTSGLAWTLDTVDTNLPEWLHERGYDVWVFDYRASPELSSSLTQFTLDDIAAKDWPAAIAEVKNRTGAATVQVVAHCVGSLTFQMALALGAIGKREVRNALCSQLTLHSNSPTLNQIKSGLHLAYALPLLGVDTLTSDITPGNFIDKLYDAALRLYPTSSRVTSETTRRILFMYGEVFDVNRLNQATFDIIPEIFGPANLTTFKHITLMVNATHIVDAHGRDVYLPHLDRLDLPITFIHGENNKLFLPPGSQRTYDALVARNGPANYRRIVIPGYAHMDCFIGNDAARDVFPVVGDALAPFNR